MKQIDVRYEENSCSYSKKESVLSGVFHLAGRSLM